MSLPVYLNVAQYPRRMRWFMAGAWLVIGLKCVVVWWAMAHWNAPMHPLWVVGPTLLFAALVTGIWLTHRPD